jgi:hypothetical protein
MAGPADLARALDAGPIARTAYGRTIQFQAGGHGSIAPD